MRVDACIKSGYDIAIVDLSVSLMNRSWFISYHEWLVATQERLSVGQESCQARAKNVAYSAFGRRIDSVAIITIVTIVCAYSLLDRMAGMIHV